MRRTLALALSGLIAVPLVTVITTGTASADVSCTGSLGATRIDDTLRVPAGATCTLVGTTIDGNLLIGRAANLTADGITVNGNVQDDSGGAGRVTIRTSKVDGSVQLERGSGRIELARSTVGGNVQPNGNTGGVVLTGNTIDGNLQCQTNNPAPTGGSNTVRGSAEDQCASLTGTSAPGTPTPPATTQRTTGRLAGADRYATSAAVSREAFPGGASTVYLARSDDAADALSAGSLSAGPVLVVPRCGTLPGPIAAEIRRLGATRVTALGGTAAVCDQILAAAAAA